MDLSSLVRQLAQPDKKPSKARAREKFEQFDNRVPHHQNAIDLVPGWTSSFPQELSLAAGHLALYADPRIAWAIERAGDLTDRTILEIGPLEGMHTYMLNRQRPRRIDAVEANRLCFLRCLVTDQILNIDRANFILGDVMKWLEEREDRYDLIVASGVLYHMADPVRFLELVAARTDRVFLWTHYFTPETMPQGDVRRRPFTGNEVLRSSHALDLRLYERSYQNTARNASFCGGPMDLHYWMHKQDILDFLRVLGFNSVEIGEDDEKHPGGPCFSLFAQRK